jgi:hypothetical protein
MPIENFKISYERVLLCSKKLNYIVLYLNMYFTLLIIFTCKEFIFEISGQENNNNYILNLNKTNYVK